MGRVHRNRSNLFQSVGIKGSKEVCLSAWSRTGSHCTTRNLSLLLRSSLSVHLEGRGNRPPAIGHHSWPAGAFPSLSQVWLAKYDSHWPPAQPRSTGIHLPSPFSLAVQAGWPRSSSSHIENLYGFLFSCMRLRSSFIQIKGSFIGKG